MKIVLISGSLREKSRNTAVAQKAIQLGSELGLELSISSIRDLPLFNEDLEVDLPASVVRFREDVRSADGVLFVTPENNYLPSAAIKNALDWLSRGGPTGSPLRDKKVGVISAGGNVGGDLARVALQGALQIMNDRWLPMKLITEPIFTLNVFTSGVFDELGTLIDGQTIQKLRNVLLAYL